MKCKIKSAAAIVAASIVFGALTGIGWLVFQVTGDALLPISEGPPGMLDYLDHGLMFALATALLCLTYKGLLYMYTHMFEAVKKAHAEAKRKCL